MIKSKTSFTLTLTLMALQDLGSYCRSYRRLPFDSFESHPLPISYPQALGILPYVVRPPFPRPAHWSHSIHPPIHRCYNSPLCRRSHHMTKPQFTYVQNKKNRQKSFREKSQFGRFPFRAKKKSNLKRDYFLLLPFRCKFIFKHLTFLRNQSSCTAPFYVEYPVSLDIRS